MALLTNQAPRKEKEVLHKPSPPHPLQPLQLQQEWGGSTTSPPWGLQGSATAVEGGGRRSLGEEKVEKKENFIS